RDVTQAVNDHQRGNLLFSSEHTVELLLRDRQSSRELSHHQCEEEFQRINVKQDYKQQDGIQYKRVSGLQPVAARVDVMVVPDLHQHGEADGEGYKALHRQNQLIKGVRHLERDDKQSHGKGKNSVGEAFQPGDLATPPAEMLFRRDKLMAGEF